MPDNLSISISADTSRARAEFELLNAKIREMRKEVRAAGKEAQAGGGVVTPRLSAATAELTALEAAQKSYARSTHATTRANIEASASFADLTKTMGGFLRAAGLTTVRVGALRFGLLALAGSEALRGLNAIVDKINELADASKKTGFSAATIQAFGRALGETGGKAEDAVGIFEKLGSEIKLTFDIYGKAAVSVSDELAQTLRTLGIDANRFNLGTAAGLRQLFLAIDQGLVKLADSGRIAEANAISLQRYGKNWREIGDAVRAYVAAAGSGASDAGPFSEQALANVQAYNIAIAGLTEAWKGLLNALAESGVFTAITEFVRELTAEINNLLPYIKILAQFLGEFGSEFARNLNTLSGGGRGGDYSGGGDLVAGASGGYIRGPGTGTSDSILARLSNGEFVMRAAAVDRWGPQFMMALNNLRNPFGYAAGGLVTPRFAMGGMVTARTADGTTVNLIFPGGTFALRADNETVGALTREARRAGMLSGGRRAGLLQ